MKKINIKKLICDHCNKKTNVLYSNLKIVDFLCKRCYTSIYEEPIILIDPHYDLREEDTSEGTEYIEQSKN